METLTQTRKSGHKDFKKKKEQSSWKHQETQGKRNQNKLDAKKRKE